MLADAPPMLAPAVLPAPVPVTAIVAAPAAVPAPALAPVPVAAAVAVAVAVAVGNVIFRHTRATALSAALDPARVSPGSRPKPPAIAVCSPTTQRTCPAATSCASQATPTLLSRPEKPPIPATLASLEMIAVAALDWLATATVPPP